MMDQENELDRVERKFRSIGSDGTPDGTVARVEAFSVREGTVAISAIPPDDDDRYVFCWIPIEDARKMAHTLLVQADFEEKKKRRYK